MKNKKIIIIIGIVLILVLVFLILLNNKDVVFTDKSGADNKETVYVPEFLDDIEKEDLGLPVESRVQALSKNEEGETEVYKIIKNDWDIVTDPSEVGSISPRAK